MTQYEMTEKLSEKMGVSLEKATEALEACDWEMLDAALMLEKEHGAANERAYSTRPDPEEERSRREEAKERRRGVVNGLGEGREADVGIAGGKTGGVLFVRGQEPRRVEGDLADQLIREVRKMVGER